MSVHLQCMGVKCVKTIKTCIHLQIYDTKEVRQEDVGIDESTPREQVDEAAPEKRNITDPPNPKALVSDRKQAWE